MTTQKVVLVKKTCLMGDMLKRVISKTAGLEVVSDVEDLAEFPEIARRTQAELAIVLLHPDEQIPELVEQVIKEHSSMRFLLMGVDGSHPRLKWNEPHEVPLDEKNLQELLALLCKGQPERIEV